jgi:DNA polymerase I
MRAINALARFYRHVWLLDFEFHQPPGWRPDPICMVAKDVLTGETLKLWLYGDGPRQCPFICDSKDLFVAYYAVAEASCFLALNWPRPLRVLDLFAEFRNVTNGVKPKHGYSLNGALAHFGLPLVAKETRELAIRGGPFTREEEIQLPAYCAFDVDALERLLDPLFQATGLEDFVRLGQALLRGRYTVAAAQVEANGTPVDVESFEPTSALMPKILLRLIKNVDANFNVYEGGTFKAHRFAAYLIQHRIAWPKLASGALALDDATFKQKAHEYPELAPLHQLRSTLGRVRLHELTIGPDRRNRTMLSVFRSLTGRDQPSNAKFIFGPSSWIRSFIVPPKGRAIAYCDYASQEVAIAAALSGDVQLWTAYQSGDVYLTFAKQAGLAPSEATQETHGAVRDMCKVLFLGIGYGMTAEGLAERSGLYLEVARDLMHRHRFTYPDFWRWSDETVNRALLGLPLETVFGWRMWWPPGCELGRDPGDKPIMRARTARNFMAQSHGSEMLRLAVATACEAGLMIDAPIHDAILIESTNGKIRADAKHLQQIMGDVSELVLGRGFRVRVDKPKIVRSGERYADARGTALFETIRAELEELLTEEAADFKGRASEIETSSSAASPRPVPSGQAR